MRATESEEGKRGGAHVEQRRKQQLDLHFNLEVLLLTRFDYGATFFSTQINARRRHLAASLRGYPKIL